MRARSFAALRMTEQESHAHDPPAVSRPLSLFADHRAQGLLLAGRQAARGLSRPQHRAFRLRRGRGASAHRRQPAARSAHLRVARLRQPGRRVALPRAVRRAQPAGRAPDQHHGVRLRAADRRCAEGARRRVHRPWPHQCRAAWRHVGSRREALPRGDPRFDREGIGQAAARLDGAVDGLDARHARSPEGDGIRLPDGLAERRPADLDEDALRGR